MKKIIVLCIIFIIISQIALSDIKNESFSVVDKPNDDGTELIIKWDLKNYNFEYFIIERSLDNINFAEKAKINLKEGEYIDDDNIKSNNDYFYRLVMYNENDTPLENILIRSALAKAQWFNSDKTPLLFLTIVLTAFILYFIFSAKKGKRLYIRKLAGLETIDEAIGRATELGKPILFVPGIMDLDNIQTIAGLNILGHIAQKVAQYDSAIHVPVCRSMVLSTAKEIVKESYLKVGRPDAYNPDSVYYLTDDQFGYVAGVDGIIVREKPAATFYLGAFYAESLILAETGFATGAIQIAGTAMPSQIPFFVTACDYTLIGEELFAASAYLSKEPGQLGCLKGQDFGKALILITIIAGIILELFGLHFFKNIITLK